MKATTAVLVAALILTLTGCASLCSVILPGAVELAEVAVESALRDVKADPDNAEKVARLAAAYALRTAAHLARDRRCDAMPPSLAAVQSVGMTDGGDYVRLIDDDPIRYTVNDDPLVLDFDAELAKLRRMP